MKIISVITFLTLMSSLAFAGNKIEFHSLIEKGMEQKKSLSRNVDALLEGAEHNEEEVEVLDFVANEIDLEAKSKIAEKTRKQKQKQIKILLLVSL